MSYYRPGDRVEFGDLPVTGSVLSVQPAVNTGALVVTWIEDVEGHRCAHLTTDPRLRPLRRRPA